MAIRERRFDVAMSRSRHTELRVLVIGLQGLGNLLLSSPLWRRLEARLDARVSLLVPDATAAILMRAIPGQREVLPMRGRNWAMLAARLAARRFDAAVVAYPGGPRSVGLAWLAGAPIRIGHVGRQGWVARTLLTEVLMPVAGRHDIEHNLDLANRALLCLGGSADDAQPLLDLRLPAEAMGRADEWLKVHGLKDRLLVGLAPGSGWRQAFKRWPLDRFVAVVRDVAKGEPDLGAVWFVGPDEAELSAAIAAAGLPLQLGQQARELEILTVAALLARCRAVASNDNGLMHLASALGVPVVAVFGPTDVARTRPYAAGSEPVVSDVPCRPCYSTLAPRFCCSHAKPMACLDAVDSTEVSARLGSLLKRRPGESNDRSQAQNAING